MPISWLVDATEFFNQQVRQYESTGGRRHSIRFVHGTAGNTVAIQAKSRGGSPTSSSDIRACLTHRPLGWEFKDLGPDPDESVSAVDRLALDDKRSRACQRIEAVARDGDLASKSRLALATRLPAAR